MRGLLLAALVLMGCSAGGEEVRKSVLTGSWYEADPKRLAETVDRCIEGADIRVSDARPAGLIVPHAGYRYSGAVAGHAYRLVKGRAYARVIILAPSHHYALNGASVPGVTHYETPLGRVPLDREVCDALLKNEHVQSVARAHALEHSIEIQLPFLQRTVKDFKLVPILVGQVGQDTLRNLTEAVARHVDEDTLVVASSDFTHYGRDYGYVPFTKDIPEGLKRLDMGAMEFVLKMDADGFLRYRRDTGATICGAMPIAIALGIFSLGYRAELLEYDTSGKMEGDYSRSVSYVAAGVFKGTEKAGVKREGRKEKLPEGERFLGEAEERALLRISRNVLETYVREGRVPTIGAGDVGITENMRVKRGVFVTLERKKELRGCIGYIVGIKPVFEAVADNTVSACSRDPRFPPVKEDELGDIDISISVMTELIPVKNVDEIKVGRDGLVIRMGRRQGVLLPQVPVEQGWDRDAFLRGICRKAGLPDGSWKSGAELQRFGAQVFGEE